MHLRLLKSDADVASWAKTVTYDAGTLGDRYPWDDLTPDESTAKHAEEAYYSAYERAARESEED
jgi:hypothetical protein